MSKNFKSAPTRIVKNNKVNQVISKENIEIYDNEIIIEKEKTEMNTYLIHNIVYCIYTSK